VASRAFDSRRFKFLGEHSDGFFRFRSQVLKRTLKWNHQTQTFLGIVLPMYGDQRTLFVEIGDAD
jgi:hypothetical protein